jgi:uncharacterized protein
MHPSYFLKTFPVAASSQCLLFSTRKCSLALVSAQGACQLASGIVPDKYADQLARLGMVVEDQGIERLEVNNLLVELNRLNRALRVSVILGMACNFACVYCYEGSQKGGAAMSDETADQLVDFLQARLAPETEKLVLNFYGGETLLYQKRIEDLTERLKPMVEAQGGALEFHLVTNGSLLTPETVNRLLPLGLKSAKIALDGPEENHNQFRPFKDGSPSFATILANVKDCCDLLPLNLVGNYTLKNYQLFPALLDQFLQEGLTPNRLQQVQFYPAMQINDQFANPEFTGGCCSIAEPWLIEAALYIREELGKRGFPLAKMRPAPCMVDIDDAFVVHHDGTIYKCITMIGHAGYEAGDIWKGMNPGWQEKYCADHWQGEERCQECEYLPLCFGGCRYMAFQRDGSMAKVDCQKEFLDATLEKMLLQDLKYRYGTTSTANPVA